MRTIRASEIGSYLFCARAWWYRRIGKPSQNEQIMKEGTTYHADHGSKVARAGLCRRIAVFLLLFAVLLLAVGIITLVLD
ncbi:MAG: hypothetical protein J7K85_00780 [Anaerolineaceae bacterium]|nr:hypothetical protein [Anaerolineaceae bacterium]